MEPSQAGSSADLPWGSPVPPRPALSLDGACRPRPARSQSPCPPSAPAHPAPPERPDDGVAAGLCCRAGALPFLRRPRPDGVRSPDGQPLSARRRRGLWTTGRWPSLSQTHSGAHPRTGIRLWALTGDGEPPLGAEMRKPGGAPTGPSADPAWRNSRVANGWRPTAGWGPAPLRCRPPGALARPDPNRPHRGWSPFSRRRPL